MIVKTDLCVIGAGSGGLSVAAGAVQMGADTVLIESGTMGGDCLNTGCVPSKALLAAARAAQAVRTSGRFGVDGHEPAVDFARVLDHVHGVIAAIAPHDSVERFEGLGVRVIQAAARFIGPDTVEAGGRTVVARRFVVATGSRPAVPPIPGLDQVPYRTNESLFERRAAPEHRPEHLPDHLIVIGGGPIGIEMAQAHRRLGARVTVLEKFTILPKDDPELVAVLRGQLVRDGIDLREGADIRRIERHGNGIAAIVAGTGGSGGESVIAGSDLLVATGRRPNVENLNLEAAGIAVGPAGITVDARLRTTNKRIHAIGDVVGGPQFTHVAGHHAGIVLRSALFRLPAKVDCAALPWVTFTDPELAQVGLTEAAARDRYGAIRVLRGPFAENDRARADGTVEGMIKVIVRPGGQIVGASIVGPHAGELLQVWTLAIAQKLKIGAVANLIAPYPTLGEAGKRAAGSFYSPTLFSDRTRRLVRFLARFG